MDRRNQDERIYGVQLLDDLHNYFPDILYNNTRFRNTRDVLDYITLTTRRRFDLYSVGRNQYYPENTRTHPSSARGSSPVPIIATIEPIMFDIPIPTETLYDSDLHPHPHLHSNSHLHPNPHSHSDINLMNILSSMLGGNPPAQYSMNFMNPIEIRPTSQQIEHATRTFNLLVKNDEDEDDVCPICQEDMNIGDRIRKITICQHVFHIGCIDTWFRCNVHCPVCRHDIRENNLNTRAQVTPQVTSQVTPQVTSQVTP